MTETAMGITPAYDVGWITTVIGLTQERINEFRRTA
jgi:hypothetical protein